MTDNFHCENDHHVIELYRSSFRESDELNWAELDLDNIRIVCTEWLPGGQEGQDAQSRLPDAYLSWCVYLASNSVRSLRCTAKWINNRHAVLAWGVLGEARSGTWREGRFLINARTRVTDAHGQGWAVTCHYVTCCTYIQQKKRSILWGAQQSRNQRFCWLKIS